MPEINLPTKSTQDEIKTNVDNVNTNVTSVKADVATVKSNVNTINTNLGTPATSASSTTSANAHAKLNWLTTNISLLSSAGRIPSIKRVQRGKKFVSRRPESDIDISIQYCDPTKSFLICDGYVMKFYASSVDEYEASVYATLTSSYITFPDIYLNGQNDITMGFSWQVIELY